jgi:predicted DNA-binding protein (MmcQ/YjbR family)
MLTTETALEKMRELCSSLPGTSERKHFDEAMFYAGKKGFASCGEKDGVCRFVFELEPEHTERLLRTDARFTRYPFAKQCLVLHAADAKSWSEVKGLVLESYELVTARARAPKAPAKKRAPPKRPPRKARG